MGRVCGKRFARAEHGAQDADSVGSVLCRSNVSYVSWVLYVYTTACEVFLLRFQILRGTDFSLISLRHISLKISNLKRKPISV